MLGHLKSHFHASITVCINLQSSLFTWLFLIKILNACLTSYRPYPSHPPLSDHPNTMAEQHTVQLYWSLAHQYTFQIGTAQLTPGSFNMICNTVMAA
jgi:hypothetical protein